MLTEQQNTILTSLGYELDRRPEAFGYLKDSSDLLSQPDALRYQMQEEGYLYIKSLLNPQDIHQSRLEIAEILATQGNLKPGYPIQNCVAKPGLTWRALAQCRVPSWRCSDFQYIYDSCQPR